MNQTYQESFEKLHEIVRGYTSKPFDESQFKSELEKREFFGYYMALQNIDMVMTVMENKIQEQAKN
jgi:lysine/ornithine N-monooxygenase